MEEKELKTSKWQRILIGVIAVVMLGATIASYVAVMILNNGDGESAGVGNDRIAYYEEKYYTNVVEFNSLTAADFATFLSQKGRVKAYNETAANADGVVYSDAVKGTGRALSADDTDYYAYYLGWCPDETVFDSSLDDVANPTGFDWTKVITPAALAETGMIAGWSAGLEGMRLGGVREITIPGELAYGETTEICGGYNKPLRFLVMVVENSEALASTMNELQFAYFKLYYAYNGVDYEKIYGVE